jgi:hypothetical protein
MAKATKERKVIRTEHPAYRQGAGSLRGLGDRGRQAGACLGNRQLLADGDERLRRLPRNFPCP